MYVEDAIRDFASRQEVADDPLGIILRSDDWGRKFIASLNASVASGRALSTRQGEFFVNLVKRYRDKIIEDGCGYSSLDLDRLILSPRYRQEPYESVMVKREVRYLGDNKLGFRFKRDEAIRESLKRIRTSIRETNWSSDLHPSYDFRHRMWIVPVVASNFKQVMNLILRNDFGLDDEVVQYLALCEASINQPPSAILDEENDRIILNICDNDLLGAWVDNVLFGAKV